MKNSQTKVEATVTGKELLRRAVNQITQHPETWKQDTWHSCGTSHCIGGWCQVIAGLPQSDQVRDEVPPLIGLSESDASWLFAANRTLSEIHAFAACFIKGETYFDRNGYDRDGYDRDGYDRDGYARNGYDRDGYARDGYARNGYDRNGYARDGYDRDGKKLLVLEL